MANQRDWPLLTSNCPLCGHPNCPDCREASVSILACCKCRARAIKRLEDLQKLQDKKDEPNETSADKQKLATVRGGSKTEKSPAAKGKKKTKTIPERITEARPAGQNFTHLEVPDPAQKTDGAAGGRHYNRFHQKLEHDV